MNAASQSIVLNSSCWIAWLDPDDPRGTLVDDVADDVDGHIAVPTIVLFEVDRWLGRNTKVDDAQHHDIVTRLSREQSIPITSRIAIRAGVLSRTYKLATADALIASAASSHGSRIFTFDRDFAAVPDVTVLA